MEGSTSQGTQAMGVYDVVTALQRQQLSERIVENIEMAQQDDDTKSQGDISLPETYVSRGQACRLLPLHTKSRDLASPLVILSLLLSATFISAAMTANFFEAKHAGLRFLYERTLDMYIEFGYHGMNLVEGLLFLYFISFDGPFISFLDDLGRRQRERGGRKLMSNRKVNAISISLLTTSVIGAILATSDGGGGLNGVINWNFHHMIIKFHSVMFAMSIFCWSRGAFADYENYEKMYGVVASTRNILFGVIHAILAFCAHLLRLMIQDIILSNTISFYLEIKESARICFEAAKDLVGARAQYLEIISAQALDKKFKEAFEKNIRVMILQNICLLTFLAEEALETNVYFLINVALAINTIKAIIFYWISCKVYSHGQTILVCAKTLDTTFGKIEIDGEEVILKNLVHKLKATPISVGSDGFVITESFVMGVFSAVFTFFCLLATARGKAT